MTNWRATFDLIEAAGERGNAEAANAAEWVSDVLKYAMTDAAYGLNPMKLDGADACERVAEALAVWLKESAPRAFADMTATRYTVTGLDDSADGMERLRSQSEFILLAYPGEREDVTPAELCGQWVFELTACAREDGFAYDAAEVAVRSWTAENESYLAAALAERRQAVARELEDANGDSDGFEPDWPPFRLYVRDNCTESEA